ncbi:hypothetical protein MCOR07_004071 [Pyricularia oryzae]|nr:hypothetical protein MCOR01_005735 [Pyricularia oryzae]KAI6261004.1 hypothetical protein MCOR19_002767 [Pyricularia oryzae]KAI6280719.1 hypothetical protein MCOR26_003638 [Pyricularia oryzae]KAI6405978.1 hypothetical protein MCOR23_002422 [Pyricularia oryzae]KAI6541064.1 hypothetical protein MCOR16_000736 [Pyricularia oryzae]
MFGISYGAFFISRQRSLLPVESGTRLTRMVQITRKRSWLLNLLKFGWLGTDGVAARLYGITACVQLEDVAPIIRRYQSSTSLGYAPLRRATHGMPRWYDETSSSLST